MWHRPHNHHVNISHNKKKIKELLLKLGSVFHYILLKYFKWGPIAYEYYLKQSIAIYALLELWNFF